MSNNRRIFFFLVALELMAGALCAKSVTVQVLQTAPCANSVFEETLVIEDAVMNTMFDMGHIVTNFAAREGGSGNLKTVNKLMDMALVAGSRYFVLFSVCYKPLTGSGASKSPEAVLMQNLEKIDWAVYDTRELALISNGSEKAAVPKKDGQDSVADYASNVAKNACAWFR